MLILLDPNKIPTFEKRAFNTGTVITDAKEKIIMKTTMSLCLLKNTISAIMSANNEPLDTVKQVAISVPKMQTRSMILRYNLVSSLNCCIDKSMAKTVTKPIRSIFIMWENPNLVDMGKSNIK